ncbi:MAG: hypothetical protein AAGM84_12215 [Pseudomonadota bacterium]
MTRCFLILAAMAGLAACQPAIPDSAGHLSNGSVNPGRGVGFENSIAQERAREAARAQAGAQQPAPAGPSSALAPTQAPAARTQVASSSTAVRTTTLPQAQTAQARPSAAVPRTTTTAAAAQTTRYTDPELAQIAARNDAAAAAANSGQAVVNASPSNAPPPIIEGPGGISNETDFAAVSARRSIESDAARQAQLRSQYQVVAPTALPSRTATGPNVVQYALSTTHAVGTRVHRRVSVASAARTAQRCAEYASADDAQAAFLARGGPRRDRLGLDPDGDGYACGWNPAPFRRAAGN